MSQLSQEIEWKLRCTYLMAKFRSERFFNWLLCRLRVSNFLPCRKSFNYTWVSHYLLSHYILWTVTNSHQNSESHLWLLSSGLNSQYLCLFHEQYMVVENSQPSFERLLSTVEMFFYGQSDCFSSYSGIILPKWHFWRQYR